MHMRSSIKGLLLKPSASTVSDSKCSEIHRLIECAVRLTAKDALGPGDQSIVTKCLEVRQGSHDHWLDDRFHRKRQVTFPMRLLIDETRSAVDG